MKPTLFLLLFTVSSLLADEGMYPISEIHKLNLKQLGFAISEKELYNPNGVSLIDAIVQVGGCTGSFVSAEGLILTNHHCAFGAVRDASSKENDYVTDGFLARTRADEIPARGYTVRITESYRDVSQEVLSGLTDGMDLADRTRAIQKRSRELVAEAEKENPGKRADVSEMFAGRTYVLFVYAFFRDVRLVYVPQRSIGEFAGEDDNWIWPRHTGDFSFLRLYVGPDGAPAAYAKENVPYKPKRYLKVQPKGVDEGDFVFILGYPGRTFRHRTSHYLAYEENVRMPYVVEWYGWQMAAMKKAGSSDRAIALVFDSRIKSLANVEKNHRGKLKGLDRLGLTAKKREEEARLQAYIDADPGRKALYGKVLSELAGVYDDMTNHSARDLVLTYLPGSSSFLAPALAAVNAAMELQKPEGERDPAFSERGYETAKETYLRTVPETHSPTDRTIFREMLLRAARLPAGRQIPAVVALLKTGKPEADIDAFLDKAYAGTRLTDRDQLKKLLDDPMAEVKRSSDPFVAFAQALLPSVHEYRDVQRRREGALTKASALYVEVKEKYQKTGFIPDANRTLRLTFGRIQGYSPSDATYYRPITTVRGVLEKSTGEPPVYNTPAKLLDAAAAKKYGTFKHPKLNDVPVALLYNLDTTGGNSGSPLLNARGEVVGVNFDRAWEATINDYAWSESYSRSIAVDIRYVLWVTQVVGEAGWLLKEMGVDP